MYDMLKVKNTRQRFAQCTRVGDIQTVEERGNPLGRYRSTEGEWATILFITFATHGGR